MDLHNQNQEMEIKSQGMSFSILILIIGLLFLPLFSRLIYLQIYQGDTLRHYSNTNRFKEKFLNAPRGLILDRNKKILVGNQMSNQLKINLNQVNDLNITLKQLSSIINTSIKTIDEKLKRSKKKYGPYHPITIKKNLTLDEIHKVNLFHWDNPGIYIDEEPIRVYPLQENGSQILGYVGKTSNKNNSISLFSSIGKRGIENLYDPHLRGQNGWNFVEVDARNRISFKSQPSGLFINSKPQQGQNITLTIDKDLQEFVYKSMNRNDSIGLRKGSIIVMKTNGEILAWVSRPSFNANIFSKNLNEKEWLALSKNSSKSFINKGIQEHYSPGSTIKPFIALASLSENLIAKKTLISSPYRLKFGNRVFHDHSIFGHGKINVTKALEKSANTFFYKLGAELGIDTITKYIRLFGFGRKTDIELNGEVTGLVPSSQWKKKRGSHWTLGDTINFSIGQGSLLVTLLQLTVAYNAIATEGLIVKPFLVKQIANQKIEPHVIDTLTDRIDRKHFKTIKEGLNNVVQGSQGTARYWKIPSIPYGGKTGTSQVISLSSKKLFSKCSLLKKEHRHHGLFIGFAPLEKTEIIVSVLTEHSCFGSLGSAPIARDIIKHYMRRKEKNI